MSRGYERGRKRKGRRKGSNDLFLHTVKFDTTIVVADPGAAVAFATAVIGGLPEANLWIGAAFGYFQVTDVGGAGLIAAFQGNLAVGSAPTADATLNNAEVDILPSTAFTASSGATPRVRAAPASAGTNIMTNNAVVLDNTDGSLELNANITIADTSISAQATVRVQGEIHMVMATMGDD